MIELIVGAIIFTAFVADEYKTSKKRRNRYEKATKEILSIKENDLDLL